MDEVPPDPHKPIAEHRESIERKLKQLEAATSMHTTSAEAFALIADETRGVLEACMDDVKRLKEQYTFSKRMLGR